MAWILTQEAYYTRSVYNVGVKRVYLLLTILGTILPYYYFFQAIGVENLPWQAFFTSITINSVLKGYGFDLAISSVVFWIWAYNDAQTNKIKYWWLAIVLNLTVGLSAGLPFYLYLRTPSNT